MTSAMPRSSRRPSGTTGQPKSVVGQGVEVTKGLREDRFSGPLLVLDRGQAAVRHGGGEDLVDQFAVRIRGAESGTPVVGHR